MTLPIQIPAEALATVCRRYNVRKLSLFGSVLRPDFGTNSDVDILVEFQPGHRIGLSGLAVEGNPNAWRRQAILGSLTHVACG